MKICIIALARLGDTVCKLPSLWALRDAYPDSHICLVSQSEYNKYFVTSKDVLGGTGLVDSFETFKVRGGKILRWADRLRLLYKLRKNKWDLGIVLMPFCRPEDQAVFETLRRYLTYFGCKQIYYPKKIPIIQSKDGNLLHLHHVSDNMLQTISQTGIEIPLTNSGKFLMPPHPHSGNIVEGHLNKLKISKSRPLVALGVGANRQTNIWPKENYSNVLNNLIKKFNVVPVFFGSGNFEDQFKNLLDDFPEKITCFGKPVCEASELLRKCLFYLGNDTGLMHLAVSVGLKCVAIFSSRDSPGLWYPYGDGHFVFRSKIQCEGCLLDICNKHQNKCLKLISVEEVSLACENLIYNFETNLIK